MLKWIKARVRMYEDFQWANEDFPLVRRTVIAYAVDDYNFMRGVR